MDDETREQVELDVKVVQTMVHPCVVRVIQVFYSNISWYIVRPWP